MLGFIEIVRRHHDGRALVREADDHDPRTRGARPDRRRRSARRERASAAGAAARTRARAACEIRPAARRRVRCGARVKPTRSIHSSTAARLSRAVEAEQPGVEPQVLFDRQIVPQTRALRHVADAQLDRLGIARDVVAEHLGRTRRTAPSTPHSIRIVVDLPAPLGPRKPQISPGMDLERDLVDGDEVAEAARQRFARDDRCVVRSSLLSLATNVSSSDGGISRSAASAICAASSGACLISGIASPAEATSACSVSPKISTLRTRGSPRSARRASPRCAQAISTTSPCRFALSSCGRAAAHDRAAHDERDAIGALGFVHVRRADEDRRSAAIDRRRECAKTRGARRGSTPAVGSSSKIVAGLWISVHASASFCFIPPESSSAETLA